MPIQLPEILRDRTRIKQHLQQSDLAYCLAVFVVWRVVVQIYAIFVLHRFPFTDTIHQPFYQLKIWYAYDGHHYVAIAQRGYEEIQHAFFPLYPLLIKLTALPATLLLGDNKGLYIVAGLLVASASLVGTMWFMLQLAKQHFDLNTGKRAIFLLLFFPSAIFLAAVYTESLFLMGATGAFYFAGRRQWWLAGIFGAVAAGTRLVGVFILPCLLIEWFVVYRQSRQFDYKQLAGLSLIVVIPVVYMLYLWLNFGDPLYFLVVQQAWGRQVDMGVIEGVWRDLQNGLNLLDFKEERIAPLYDGLSVVFGFGMAIAALVKRYYAWALYLLAMTSVPLASGVTYGMIRYIIILFPAFLLLGWWTRRQSAYSFVLAAFVIFFSILSVHYLNSWWLA